MNRRGTEKEESANRCCMVLLLFFFDVRVGGCVLMYRSQKSMNLQSMV